MPAPLELPQPRRLLDEGAPVLGLGCENRLDLALADDRVHRGAEPDVREQLDEIGAAHGSAVHEVLALGAPHEPARDGDLAEVELGEVAVLVVEHELDLAVLGALAVGAAGEEDVVRLLGAHLRRRERTGRPHDRVGDVRLAGAVRADDHGHARLQAQLERVGERLEAADADRLQVHRRCILTIQADVAAVLPLELLGNDAESVERLARGFLLGGLLRRSAADSELGAGDVRGADEPAVVRRALHLEHRVVDLPTRARERFLELGLVVDVARARVLDLVAEGRDDRLLDRLEPVLEVDRRERGLEQGREDVSARRDAVELVGRDSIGPLEEPVAEVELLRHDGAARPGDDVRTDLREAPFGGVAEAVVDRTRDGELEDAVAEELQPLVRRGPLVGPGRVGEDLREAVRR